MDCFAALAMTLVLFFSAPAMAACSSPAGNAGDTIYNADNRVPQYCDGTNWVGFGAANVAASSGSCTGPAGAEGQLIYNEEFKVVQYCDGDNWQAAGPKQYPTIPGEPTSGLVGHWKLDETSGSSIADSAGSNTGTWVDNADNDVSGETGAGIEATALTFDGTDDEINLGDPAILQLGTAPFTLSAWVKATNANHDSAFFAKRRNSGAIDMVLMRLGGMAGLSTVASKQMSVILRADGSNQWVAETTNDVIDGGWHHVVLRRTATDASLFVDGVSQALTIEADAGTSTQSNVDVSGVNWYIGSNGATSYTNGSVDDARIYDRALSDDEIMGLYLNSGLAGWWKLDETANFVATDNSGNGNDGLLSGMNPPSDWVAGRINNALEFNSDAGGNDYVTMNNTGSLDFGSNGFSVSYWGRYSDLTGSNGLVTKRPGATGAGWATGITATGLAMVYRLDDGTTAQAGGCGSMSDIRDSVWRHYTFVFDRDGAGMLNTYLNGLLLGSCDISAVTGSVNTASPFNLNAFNNAASVAKAQGALDDVRVYNHALSADAVAYLAKGDGTNGGLVGWWKLDDGAGTTATDSSGNGNNGTLTNMDAATDWVTGPKNGALDFDGVDDFVNIPHSASLNVNDVVSIAAWVKGGTQPDNYGMIVSKNASAGGTPGFELDVANVGPDLQIRIDTSAGDTQSRFVSNVFDNTWHHVVVVLDNGSIDAYLDGTLVPLADYLHGTGFGNTNDIRLGNRPVPAYNYFTGQIDDVRIYDRALTASEALLLYGCTAPSYIEGSILYNSAQSILQYCNGDGWIGIGK